LAKFDLTDGLHPNVSNASKCFYFHLNLNESFLISPGLIEAVGPYPNARKSLKCFQIYPKLEWKCLVGPKLIKAVAITTWFQFTQRQFLFCYQRQKEWQKNLRLFCRFGHCYALVGKIDTISLTCECSCILCPNVENFCPNNSQFFSIGDATASPASHAIRLWWQVCDTSKLNCEWFADPNFFSWIKVHGKVLQKLCVKAIQMINY